MTEIAHPVDVPDLVLTQAPGLFRAGGGEGGGWNQNRQRDSRGQKGGTDIAHKLISLKNRIILLA